MMTNQAGRRTDFADPHLPAYGGSAARVAAAACCQSQRRRRGPPSYSISNTACLHSGAGHVASAQRHTNCHTLAAVRQHTPALNGTRPLATREAARHACIMSVTSASGTARSSARSPASRLATLHIRCGIPSASGLSSADRRGLARVAAGEEPAPARGGLLRGRLSGAARAVRAARAPLGVLRRPGAPREGARGGARRLMHA